MLSTLKRYLLKLLYIGNSSKEDFNKYQKIARVAEWEAIRPFIPPNSRLLDVGCGTGYFLMKAAEELGCDCTGIDPAPHLAGVKTDDQKTRIIQASAENIPFPGSSFDVILSSHVLEHLENKTKFLDEIKRVAKRDSVLIIGMPTATMAILALVENMIFTTHQRMLHFLFPKRFGSRLKLKYVFLPPSHSETDKTLLYDLLHYRISSWRKILDKELSIERTVLPALYPYPDFLRIFKLRRMKNWSSSVFFICKLK